MQANVLGSRTNVRSGFVPARVRVSQEQDPWLQVMSHLSPEYGGIATSVPQQARATEATSTLACPVVGFCQREELDQVPLEQQGNMEAVPGSRLRWVLDRRLRRSFEKAIKAAAGVHIHGLWETHCAVAATVARQHRRPYVISAHGMLEQWALRQKRLKKALYGALVELRAMQNAACLRALSADEVDDFRRLGLRNPIAIIPNCVEAPLRPSPDLLLKRYPELSGKKVVLFMGRLHPKKGLQVLIDAWGNLISTRDDIRLIVAGPDCGGYRNLLESRVAELGFQDSVIFTGMLSGDLKWSMLAAADMFVLPSYSEGFSVAILEALAAGVPVIATQECHISEIASANCGIVIPAEAADLQVAIRHVLNLPSAELTQMQENARSLVRLRFSPDVVGTQLGQLYSWLSGGNKPSAFQLA